MDNEEVPLPENDTYKEVYAFFGYTFYWAQVLEQGVINFAVALHAKQLRNSTAGDITNLYETVNKKTFGRLFNEIKRMTSISDELMSNLEKVVSYRNYLAHSFFVEHSEDLLSNLGRRKMIDELRRNAILMKKIDSQLDPVWLEAWKFLGITQEWIDQQVEIIKSDINRIKST